MVSLRTKEELGLSNNNLSGGAVPKELGHCRNLRSLSLEFNNEAWTVPEEVERLRHLVHLSDSSR